MMPAANDILQGWSPIGGDDEDVDVSQDMFFMTIKPFHSSSSRFLSPVCPPLDALPAKACPSQFQSTPLAPLQQQGMPHSPTAPSSDRRAQRNRNRDPNWIPRPRNAFIIFRCDYSRVHSQDPHDSQNDDDPTNPTVKTLSKRAAEAWRELPERQRERYKLLADKEKDQHGRLYPHYRFRPMKRQASSARKASSESSKSTRVVSAERPASSAHLPSVLSSAPEKARSSSSREPAEVSRLARQPTVMSSQGLSSTMPRETEDTLLESLSLPVDVQGDVRLSLDYNHPLSYFSSPEETKTSSSDPSSPVSVDLCSPIYSVPTDTLCCDGSAFGFDPTKEDLERAQALEAYAIGLYNFDLFSPFSFPEYC